MEIKENLHHLLSGIPVQSTGWFICEEKNWVIDQGTGNSHPLTLPPGESFDFAMCVLQGPASQPNRPQVHPSIVGNRESFGHTNSIQVRGGRCSLIKGKTVS